ncbi:MAG: CNNM domain-containing protein [Planctomycetota bacterium]
MLIAFALFAVGLALSAVFSGSETGFYRVSRVRLLIDSIAGDQLARRLLWASNNPAAFVATALVGNNVANYLTSRSIVMLAGLWFPGAAAAEVLLPLVATPVVFIYGELLPKKLFFAAPYRLLRRCTPALLVAGVLFSVVSVLLWLVSRLIESVSKTTIPIIRMELARRELASVLAEGHAVGLLESGQQRIVQMAITLGARPIKDFMTPASRTPRASTRMSAEDGLRLARRQQRSAMPVEDPAAKRAVVGYFSAVDCLLEPGKPSLPIRPLREFQETDGYLATLLAMQADDEPLALVRNAAGRVVGFLTADRLKDELLTEA